MNLPRQFRSLHSYAATLLLIAPLLLVLAGVLTWPQTSAPAEDQATPGNVAEADLDIVRQIAHRIAFCLDPSPDLKSLEYEVVAGFERVTVRLVQGECRRYSAWQGTRLRGGMREVFRSFDDFICTIERKPEENGDTFTLHAVPKPGCAPIRFEAGAGVGRAQIGHSSHPAQETTLTIDARRLVPLEERTGGTTIRYADWQEVQPGRWVPARIDVVRYGIHYRMHFDWLGNAVWLIHQVESVSSSGTTLLTRVRNVRVNGKPAEQPSAPEELKARDAAREYLTLLDNNRLWLGGGPHGVGWQPAFDTLSYTFNTVREDVREACAFDRTGAAVIEVVHDGQNKMKDRLSDRRVALDNNEYALSHRGAHFAALHQRTDQEKEQPYDLSLKHYARVGCQFDLPLFRHRERLEFANIELSDGAWNDIPCRIATTSHLGRGVFLGCGTMFGFTSWSYVHHIAPGREVLYFDRERNVPIHETLTGRDKTFEIDFDDYVEVVPGQWAPLSIRIESPGYFTCEYQFQIVAGTHWLLREVVSWFKPEEKSRGVIENVQINGERALLDDALRQVDATRRLFGGQGESDKMVDLAVERFVLGDAIRAGPYELNVTVADRRTVVVAAAVSAAESAVAIPVGILDRAGRLLFAPSIPLGEAVDGRRQGRAELRASEAWREAHSIVLPARTGVTSARRAVNGIPFRWEEPIAINVPDSEHGRILTEWGSNKPHAAETRAFQLRFERQPDGSAGGFLDVVSQIGLKERFLDLPVALVGKDGEVLASGNLSTNLRGVSGSLERQFELSTGPIPVGQEPRFVIVGVTPGDVLGQHYGSTWATNLRNTFPFDAKALLDAPDDDCRIVGLEALGARDANETIKKEFTSNDRPDKRRIGDGPVSRRTLLRPHADALKNIIRESQRTDVIAAAARFLAYSEAADAAASLSPLLAHAEPAARDAAAIGLTFLGNADYLNQLKEILAREAPSWETDRVAARAYASVEFDVLAALTHQQSPAAIDVLGETLLADLAGLQPTVDEEQRTRLAGRLGRAQTIGKLLGNAGDPRAVHWLAAAADIVSKHPELAKPIRLNDLIASLLRFEQQSQELVVKELESGTAPDAWFYAISHIRNEHYIPSVRKLLVRDDVSSSRLNAGVRYLWNVGTPAAVAVLREIFDRGQRDADHRHWLTLCHALAAKGDARGLGDAFDTLVELERPAAAPDESRASRRWPGDRDSLARDARQIATAVPREALMEYLLSRSSSATAEDQRVIIELLWTLPTMPPTMRPTIEVWAVTADEKVAAGARRVLDAMR